MALATTVRPRAHARLVRLADRMVVGAALAVLSGCADQSTARISADYIADARCAECHTSEFERWTGSHHDLAMQVANEESVLGDFDDAEFTHFDEVTRFFRRDGRFFVNTTGPEGSARDFEISYTFGVTPLQQYLIEFEGGKFQCLSVAWDTTEKSWFHLYQEEAIGADDPLHWTHRYQRWNAMCAACHSTDLQRGYDAANDTYETTWKEIDVGCQACHGPGSAHAAWAEAGHAGGDLEPAAMGLMVPLRRGAQTAQMDACAPCHSRRTPLLDVDTPGESFLDRYLPERLHAGFYYPDGQILDEVYVYGSFAQSKMYVHGVTCTDCHDPHTSELLLPNNGVCMQCHTTIPPVERFSTLEAKNYDTSEHHHHESGTPGALCVNCHMTERTYMVVDPRRDHSFRIPRPDLTELLGTPNACNGCHTELDAAWATEKIEAWTGTSERPRHFAPIFAAAQAGVPEAAAALTAVSQDPETAPIVRATALELLRGFGMQGVQAMMASSEDADPIVRVAAVGGLGALPEDARAKLVPRLLHDPVRAVRIEAARVLAGVPGGSIPEADRAAQKRAFQEFLDAQAAHADLPGAHLNIGVVRTARGETGSAEASYRKALALDPYFLPASFNLANLLNSQGRNDEAERILATAIEHVPLEGELHFSHGLLLAEMGRKEDAAVALRSAAKLLPQRPRVLYNLGMLLRDLGNDLEAESALVRAHEAAREDADPLHALVLFYIERKEWKRALPFAERLVKLLPRDPTARELLDTAQRAE